MTLRFSSDIIWANKNDTGMLLKQKTRTVDSIRSFFTPLKECRDKELYSRQGIRGIKRRENENNTKGYRCEFVSVWLKQNSLRNRPVRWRPTRDLL